MDALTLIDALVAASSITIRTVAPFLVRWVPSGPHYLDIIYYSFGLYILTFVIQYLHPQSSKTKRFNGSALLFGWNDSERRLSSIAGFIINLACLLAALDFVYRPEILHQSQDLKFSRLGFVDTTSARIVLRVPNATAVEIQVRPDSQDGKWSNAAILTLSQGSDYVGTFEFQGLRPATAYQYQTNTSQSGSFRTATSNPKQWTMLSTSCILPFFPYNPLDHSLRITGLEYLNTFVKSTAVDFMLFLGDFIYIDLPQPQGWTEEFYNRKYRQVYASPSWSDELRSLPWIHAYDDHEIINDWSANDTGLYPTAMGSYWDYQGFANPPSMYGKTYYTFVHGDIAFFVMDSRRYRSPADMVDGPEKTMLGSEQLKDLKSWLASEKRWKMVVSSVPFSRNWRGWDARDSWAGYLWERQQVLEMMWESGDVVIISGDRHEHGTTKFPSPDGSNEVIEFSTSPLNQFYEPFDRNFRQIEESDIAIYNQVPGSSKFGVFTFDTSDRGTWSLRFDLIVNGVQDWSYTHNVTRKIRSGW